MILLRAQIQLALKVLAAQKKMGSLILLKIKQVIGGHLEAVIFH